MRVLEELRRLEEAQGRGEVDEAEVQKLRDEILSMVEDAEVSDTVAPPEPQTAAPNPLLQGIALAVVGLVGFTALMAWLFNDLSMGITLGIAALAVVIIVAFQRLEDARDTQAEPMDLDDSIPE